MAMTIGQPKLILQKAGGLEESGGFSYVRLFFLHDDKVVNLFSGEHPIIKLNKTDISIDLIYQGDLVGEDIYSVLNRQVSAKVCLMLNEKGIEVKKELCSSCEYGYFRVQITTQEEIPGLIYDGKAIAYEKWFT